MSTEYTKIERVRISGFKSIREADIALGPLNVVIGANGAGKSNLVSYFSLVKASLNGQLDEHVARHGGPDAYLHLGPKVTKEIKSFLTVSIEAGRGLLYLWLVFQAPGNLVFVPDLSEMNADFQSGQEAYSTPSESLTTVNLNKYGSKYAIKTIGDHGTDHLISNRLRSDIGVYHFNDTTLPAPIRTAGYIEDNRHLLGDGGNLAAMLFRLRETNLASYSRIIGTIRQIAPFFDDFSLAPRALNPTQILLNWKQIGSETEWGPHQLSDGTLRAMAMITLLLQPEAELPKLIVIDEPEIGLHPYAVGVIVSLLRKASHHTQIIVATQSPQLLDECDPEDVICVDRQGQESLFTRPDPDQLREWLSDYSLGEVWQKNVIGGGPH